MLLPFRSSWLDLSTFKKQRMAVYQPRACVQAGRQLNKKVQSDSKDTEVASVDGVLLQSCVFLFFVFFLIFLNAFLAPIWPWTHTFFVLLVCLLVSGCFLLDFWLVLGCSWFCWLHCTPDSNFFCLVGLLLRQSPSVSLLKAAIAEKKSYLQPISCYSGGERHVFWQTYTKALDTFDPNCNFPANQSNSVLLHPLDCASAGYRS